MKKLGLMLIILLAFPSMAGGKSKTIHVENQTVRWTSPQSFNKTDDVRLRVRYKRTQLTGVEVVRGCVFDFSGYGIIARVWACDDHGRYSRLRIHVASARPQGATVRFVFWRQG